MCRRAVSAEPDDLAHGIQRRHPAGRLLQPGVPVVHHLHPALLLRCAPALTLRPCRYSIKRNRANQAIFVVTFRSTWSKADPDEVVQTLMCCRYRRAAGGKARDQAVPDAHKPDPAAHPAAALGQPPCGAVPGRRPSALRHHLRGAVLCHDLHLAGVRFCCAVHRLVLLLMRCCT